MASKNTSQNAAVVGRAVSMASGEVGLGLAAPCRAGQLQQRARGMQGRGLGANVGCGCGHAAGVAGEQELLQGWGFAACVTQPPRASSVLRVLGAGGEDLLSVWDLL